MKLKCLELMDSKLFMRKEMNSSGLILVYSGKCMNTCGFCSGITPVTSWDSLIKVADELLSTGVDGIEFGGHDPGEYARLPELIEYLMKGGVDNIYIETHGRTFKDEALVSFLASTRVVKLLKIPLYGSTAEMHNKFTQISNSSGNAFEDTIAGLKNCAKYNIPIQGAIMPTQYNKDFLDDVISLYLDTTSNKLENLYIRAPFITDLNHEAMKDWFLPIKDMGPFIKKILSHPIPKNVNFKIQDIPHCVVEEYSPLIENNFYTYIENEGKAGINMGIIQRATEIKELGVPHFRIKYHFQECNLCALKNKCQGISLNEFKMFGAEGLKGIKV
jgi:MoaA/NifB/PqqE/SkfB family radical SAM enzyme